MLDRIIIREARHTDAQEIFKVISMAFGRDNEAILVQQLEANPSVFIDKLSLVATCDNEIIGHVLFTKITIQDSKGNAHESLALAPIAVKPSWQRSGIGGQLISRGLHVAKGLAYRSVIVLGHATYYPRFGFTRAEKWNIKAPYDVPSDVFMAIELVKDGLINVEGNVIYPKEFETV